MQEYRKAVSLGHYFIYYSSQTYHLTGNYISNLADDIAVIYTDMIQPSLHANYKLTY
jgi:hypothetical protein